MQNVQFRTANIDATHSDLSTLGISHELIRPKSLSRLGFVVAQYEPGSSAGKLREYLETHHLSETEGKLEMLPVDGWLDLVEATKKLH